MHPYNFGRYRFLQDTEYAGKLIAVTHRCIENRRADLALLRLEFEIFERNEQQLQLTALCAVASRDLVITTQATSDDGVRRFATALNVPRPDAPASWYGLQRRQAPVWLLIRFGDIDERDFRQPFTSISPFDLQAPDNEYKIVDIRIPVDRAQKYVTSSQAAKFICLGGDPNRHPNPKTVNQFVDEMEAEHGKRLVYRTTGRQRRINWRYLQQLWNRNPDK